jgi:hypothetical protein
MIITEQADTRRICLPGPPVPAASPPHGQTPQEEAIPDTRHSFDSRPQ